MEALPVSYTPHKLDVICARGKLALKHDGNKRLRALVKHNLPMYSASKCKFQKSKIVADIVDAIRSASPQGGFIKFVDDRWYTVSDRHAREKVGQGFRDQLHNQYPSSAKAKAKARKEKSGEGSTLSSDDLTTELSRCTSSAVSWTTCDRTKRENLSNETFSVEVEETQRDTQRLPSFINVDTFSTPLGGGLINADMFIQYEGMLEATKKELRFDSQSTNELLSVLRDVSGDSEHQGAPGQKKDDFLNKSSCSFDFEPLPMEHSALDKIFDISMISDNAEAEKIVTGDDVVGEVCNFTFDEIL